MLKYQSGEPICRGDRITYDGSPGVIEIVVEEGDFENGWYLENYGPGVMVAESPEFGRVYVTMPGDFGDLVFVARGTRS